MTKSKIRLLFSLILLILLACNKIGTEVTFDEVAVEVLDDSIRLTNNNSSTIHYLVVERRTAAFIDWTPSCGVEEPNQIHPGKSMRIPYENITGYFQDCEVILYWWSCQNFSYRASRTLQSEVIQTK